jgi:hypothetical protein
MIAKGIPEVLFRPSYQAGTQRALTDAGQAVDQHFPVFNNDAF